MTKSDKKSFFSPGWEWPVAIVAFFILLAVINAWVTFQGVTKSGSMIEDGAYEKGLKYQETIDKLAAVRKLGWQVDFSAGEKRDTGRLVKVSLLSAENVPLGGAQVSVKAIRPSNAASDTSAVLDEVSTGQYQAAFPLRESGLWYFEIAIIAGSHEGLVKLERML